jgi:hypothetical protein
MSILNEEEQQRIWYENADLEEENNKLKLYINSLEKGISSICIKDHSGNYFPNGDWIISENSDHEELRTLYQAIENQKQKNKSIDKPHVSDIIKDHESRLKKLESFDIEIEDHQKISSLSVKEVKTFKVVSKSSYNNLENELHKLQDAIQVLFKRFNDMGDLQVDHETDFILSSARKSSIARDIEKDILKIEAGL